MATEDLLYMLNGLHIETGVDLEALTTAGLYISAEMGREPVSKIGALYAETQ